MTSTLARYSPDRLLELWKTEYGFDLDMALGRQLALIEASKEINPLDKVDAFIKVKNSVEKAKSGSKDIKIGQLAVIGRDFSKDK
jgi:hypothetical protein